jgi:hypothetical protein
MLKRWGYLEASHTALFIGGPTTSTSLRSVTHIPFPASRPVWGFIFDFGIVIRFVFLRAGGPALIQIEMGKVPF